jgi:hypothetical protein
MELNIQNPDEPIQPDIIIKAVSDQSRMIQDFWYFAQLLNQILPKTGINAFIEITEDGFLLFCEHEKDFFGVFANPLSEKKFNLQNPPKVDFESNISFYWEFEFISPLPNEKIDQYGEIIHNYWAKFNALFSLREKDEHKKFILYYKDIEHYNRSQDILIKRLNDRLNP